jgi:hypothetical protein
MPQSWDEYASGRRSARQSTRPGQVDVLPAEGNPWDDYASRRRSARTPTTIDVPSTTAATVDVPSGSTRDMGWRDWAAMAARVGGGVGGSILGGALGSIVPVAGTAGGAIAGGGIGSGIGEWLAQKLEGRDETNYGQVAAQTALGALPIGRVKEGASLLRQLATRGAQGSLLNVGGAELTERAETGNWLSPELQADPGTLRLAALLGAGGGAALGGLERGLSRGGRRAVPPGAGGGDDAEARKAAYWARRSRETYDTSPVDPTTITYGGASSPNAKGEGVSIPREGGRGPILGDWRPWHGSRTGRHIDPETYRQGTVRQDGSYGPVYQGVLGPEPTAGMAGLSRSRANAGTADAIPQDFTPNAEPFIAPPEPFSVGSQPPRQPPPTGPFTGGNAVEPFEAFSESPSAAEVFMEQVRAASQRPRISVPMDARTVPEFVRSEPMRGPQPTLAGASGDPGAGMLTPGMLDTADELDGPLTSLDVFGAPGGKATVETTMPGQPSTGPGTPLPPSGKPKVPSGLLALRDMLKPRWAQTAAETGSDMTEDLPEMFRRIVAYARTPELRRKLMGAERKVAKELFESGQLPGEDVIPSASVAPEPPFRRGGARPPAEVAPDVAAAERAAIMAEDAPPPSSAAEVVQDWLARYNDPPPRAFSELHPEEQREFRRIYHELAEQPFARGRSVEQLENDLYRSGDEAGASFVRGDSNPNLLPITPNAPIYRAIQDASGRRRTGRSILSSMAAYEAGKRPTAVTADVLRVIRRMLGGVGSEQFLAPDTANPRGVAMGDKVKRLLPPDAGDIPIDPSKRFTPDPDVEFNFGANADGGDEGFAELAGLLPLAGGATGAATGAAADDENRWRGAGLGLLAGALGARGLLRGGRRGVDAVMPQAGRGLLDVAEGAQGPLRSLDAIGGPGGRASVERALPGQTDDIDSLLAQLGGGDDTGFDVLDPMTARLNASGESSASLEALSRQSGMRSRGEQFVVYDRTGQRRPLLGPDAVDYAVRPGETYGIEGPNGFRVLDDAGGRAPRRPQDVPLPGLAGVRETENALPPIGDVPFSLTPPRSTPEPLPQQSGLFDESGFARPEILAPIAGAGAGAVIGPMIEDDPTVGGIGGALHGGLAGLLATPAGRRALIQARYGNMLSYMAVPKSLIGNLSGVAAHALERPERAGRIASELFSGETVADVPRQWRSGQFRENAPNEATSALNLPGRVMGAGDQVAQGVLRRSGATPDEAEELMLTSMPRSPGLRKLQEGLTAGDWASQLARLAVPFSKTAFNLLERGVERLPGVGGMASVRQMSNPTDDIARRRQILGTLAGAAGAGIGMSEAGGFLEENPWLLPFIAPMAGPYALPTVLGMAGGMAFGNDGGADDIVGDMVGAGISQMPVPEPWTLEPQNILRSNVPYGGLMRHVAPVQPNELETRDSLFAPSLAQIPFANEWLLPYRPPTRRAPDTRPRW